MLIAEQMVWYEWVPAWISAGSVPIAICALWWTYRSWVRAGFSATATARSDRGKRAIRVAIANAGRLDGTVERVWLIRKVWRKADQDVNAYSLETGHYLDKGGPIALPLGRSLYLTLTQSEPNRGSEDPPDVPRFSHRNRKMRVRILYGNGSVRDVRVRRAAKIDRYGRSSAGVLAPLGADSHDQTP